MLKLRLFMLLYRFLLATVFRVYWHDKVAFKHVDIITLQNIIEISYPAVEIGKTVPQIDILYVDVIIWYMQK